MTFDAGTASPLGSIAKPGTTAAQPLVRMADSTVPAIAQALTGQFAPASSNIAFVDRAIADIDTLIQGISATQLVFIDTATNGIDQITQTLSQSKDLASVQIFAHGAQASLNLGNAQLSTHTLDAYADALTQWGTALSPTGDLLLYGCNVAAGPEGDAFIEQLSQLTSADVAASSDLTGAQGNWVLEEQTGTIESKIALTADAQAAFADTLNLLTNGGFENGINGWFGFSGQETAGGNGAFDGSAALQLTTADAGTAQTLGATAGETYTLEGYAKSSTSSYSAMGLTFFDTDYNTLSYNASTPISGNSWQRYEVEATAPTGTAFAQVWTYRGGNDGVVAIDALDLSAGGTTPPASDTARPTASVSAATVNAAASSYEFSIDYSDNVAIDVSTLGNGDVRVTGPNGFNQQATFIAVNNNTDGPTRTARYRITPPDGSWSNGDNGTYTVALQPNQVSDTSNNALLATNASFEVNIASNPGGGGGGGGTELLTNGGFENGLDGWFGFSGQEQLSTSQTFSGSQSLQLSTADSGIGKIISGSVGETYTLTGYAKSSSNGYNAFGLNFFDANYNVVGRAESGNITAQNWRQYEMEETAPAGTQFVQVWAYKGNSNGDTFIDDLSLKAGDSNPPAADTTAPTASISAADVNSNSSQYDFAITYTDNAAIDVATLDNNDVRVTGPNGFSQLATLVSSSNNSNGSPRTATYRINAPGGSWQQADNGTYTVRLRANQVRDESGNAAAATTATFAVNVSAPSGDTPVISSNGGGASATISLGENTQQVTDVNATGSGIVYAIAGGTDAGDFNINSNTGVLSFKTAPDYENPNDAGSNNTYEVNVSATNGAGQSDTQSVTVNVTNEVSVFLVGGQSNAVGLASNSNLPANLAGDYPAVQIWQENIQDFSNLRPGFASPNGDWPEFGPELTFGRGIDGFAPEEVYLIKHAEGATDLANDWDPDGANNREYDIFTDRVSDALAELESQNIGYDIEGMVWMQGESDTGVTRFDYEANLTAFIADMRSRYGADMRFVIGKLSPTFAGVVTDAQEAVAAADSRNYIVNTDSFELLPDQIHYTAAGQVALGFGFADAIKNTF
ncbi:MAG: DUF4347 domain-containing protein [Cyanobacteria bacterium J06597_16]